MIRVMNFIFSILFFMMCTENKKSERKDISVDTHNEYSARIDSFLSSCDSINALLEIELLLELNVTKDLLSQYYELSSEMKLFDRKIRFLKTLTKNNKTIPDCHFYLGMAYIDKIQENPGPEAGMLVNLALKGFHQAISLDSLYWPAHYALGITYLHMPLEYCCVDSSIQIFEKLILIQEKSDSLLPNFAGTYVSLGDAYYKNQNFSEARRIWEQGLETFPENNDLKQRLRYTK